MRPLFFLVGHPFGDPANEETIFEGPLSTQEIANAALETHLANGGQPARVVCLAERVEPVAYVVTYGGRSVAPVSDDLTQHFCTLDKARFVVGFVEAAGVPDVHVFGLVPAKG